jgi:hypothetical protein
MCCGDIDDRDLDPPPLCEHQCGVDEDHGAWWELDTVFDEDDDAKDQD